MDSRRAFTAVYSPYCRLAGSQLPSSSWVESWAGAVMLTRIRSQAATSSALARTMSFSVYSGLPSASAPVGSPTVSVITSKILLTASISMQASHLAGEPSAEDVAAVAAEYTMGTYTVFFSPLFWAMVLSEFFSRMKVFCWSILASASVALLQTASTAASSVM